MRLGTSTASFFLKSETENTLCLIQEYGIKTVEIFLTTFREYEKDFVDELVKRKGNLEVFSVHTLNQEFEPELFSSYYRAREDAEVFFDKIVYAMKELDAKYYTFHGPARLKRTPYNINIEKFGNRLDALNQRIKSVKEDGQICYENVHWSYFNSPQFFDELKKYTNVSTCLDIKQAMQSKYSCYDYIDSMGDRLKNVHLCDYDENGKLMACGKGVFDFVKLFKHLVDIGYDGPLMMEIYPESYDTLDGARQSYEYLSECLIKVGL